MTSHVRVEASAVPVGTGAREPLWRHLVGGVLRRERAAQRRTLKDVADAARISMPYLSELERGRKEASSEVLAAAAGALGLGLAGLLAAAQRDLDEARPASRRPSGRKPAPERPAPHGEDAGREAVAPAPRTRAAARTERTAVTGRAPQAGRHGGLCLAA